MIQVEERKIERIPALIWGKPTDFLYLYIHGKFGYKEEAGTFAQTACQRGWQVLSFDLPGHGERKKETGRFVPWHMKSELELIWRVVSHHWNHIALRATSIGVWFSLLSYADKPLEKALFVSPLLDMERVIYRMMRQAGVTSEILEQRQEISTDFGETLSWDYYTYAREHTVKKWKCPTEILYGKKDDMVEKSVIEDFCDRFQCHLTEMEDGEHWFHTEKQTYFLKEWEDKNI